ncbi:MAG TPA: BamA/TamA family outer membrane protein [Bacteroidia bacterium]|nr:BamA/TamA family outer membrane protein [Bacteroidia bacterium]HRG52186.1 BamA/TamA family outer membrane protein [Bacteroidia bacterium]
MRLPFHFRRFNSSTFCTKEVLLLLFFFIPVFTFSQEKPSSDSLKQRPSTDSLKQHAPADSIQSDTVRALAAPAAFFSNRGDYTLRLMSVKDEDLISKIDYRKNFISKETRAKELQRLLFVAFDNAYLTAEYDSLKEDSTSLTAYLNFGKQYKWASLRKGNVDEGVLSQIGFREKLYRNKPVYFKDVKRAQELLIRYFENNGYPFASVKLDSIEIQNAELNAVINLTKNNLCKIDSVVIKGNAKIASVYIYNYLGIKPGNLYNESQLKKVNTRIAELPFLKATSPANVIFTDRQTKLFLYLEKKRANQFDGIIGMLPDDVTGKILFTGDVHLNLQNGLGRGEIIDLNWRRLQTQTQDLKMRLVYPFLLKSPLGVDYNFKLYKKDTTFLEVTQNIGLQYLLIGGNYFKIFYNNKISNLLSTKGLEFSTTLPPYIDYQTNQYGIGVKYERLDYRLNPRKGFYTIVNASAGTKAIKKNAKLNPDAYDGIKLNSAIYSGDIDAGIFFPVFSRMTIKLGAQGAFLQGETTFQNELFRIGGLKSLRGFDEESIFASAFSIIKLEYRYILEQNSYMYLFGDGAWYENNSVKNYIHDTPYGFGAGISFQTKAGIFSISYALGSQFNNPIQLRSGKIHFGIVNYF